MMSLQFKKLSFPVLIMYPFQQLDCCSMTFCVFFSLKDEHFFCILLPHVIKMLGAVWWLIYLEGFDILLPCSFFFVILILTKKKWNPLHTLFISLAPRFVVLQPFSKIEYIHFFHFLKFITFIMYQVSLKKSIYILWSILCWSIFGSNYSLESFWV